VVDIVLARQEQRMRGLTVATLVLALGCVPQTTLRLRPQPVQAAPDLATVVLVYPAVSGSGQLNMPLLQPHGQGVWFRFASNHRRTLADLEADSYAVVNLTPGEHTIVASSWAADDGDHQVAVLDARVSSGRVYVVELTFDTRGVSLVPVAPAQLTAALQTLPRYQRLSLDPARGDNLILDSELRAWLIDRDAAAVRRHGGATTLID